MTEAEDTTVILEPAPEPEGLPHPKPIHLPVPKDITDADIEAFARNAGMSHVTAAHLRACKGLGDYVDQLGAVAMGRGILLETQATLRHVFAEVGHCVKNPPARGEDQSEAELKIALFKSTAEISDKLIKCASELIGSEKVAREANGAGLLPSPFGRGTPVVPIQAQNLHLTVSQNE